MRRKILIVDDDPDLRALVELELRGFGMEPEASGTAEEALGVLDTQGFDAVLTDVSMPGMGGIALCERIVHKHPNVPVIVMTAFGTLESAVAAIRVGAYDYITKPLQFEALRIALDRALRHRLLADEVKRLRQLVTESHEFEELAGSSPAMQSVYSLLGRVADSNTTVLVTGESGTGKELVARALHKRSKRKDGPMVAINCAAMPEALLESELFGHARGAFTDARQSRQGLFAKANGGTLFLDEIGDMPMSLQSKLLRALQERSIRPVGSDTDIPIDVRLIAATHRDLETAVEERTFREDLYYRINVIHLELPPLRARGADVLLLAQKFLDRFATTSAKQVTSLSSGAAHKMMAYGWPGNVRELQNCIERAVALAQYEQVSVDDLPDKIRNYKSSHVVVAAEDPSELVPMDEVERRYVLKVLDAVAGNKVLAARVLGFDRKTLYRKLERYGAGSEARGPERPKDTTG